MKKLLTFFLIGLTVSLLACSNDDTEEDILDIVERQVREKQQETDSVEVSDSNRNDSNVVVNNTVPDSLRMNIDANCSVNCPLLVAHAGGKIFGPPNSIPSFNGAGMIGMWGCETDVWPLADGTLVCYHDKTLDSGTNGTGDITQLKYQELRKFKINDYSDDKSHYDYSKFTDDELRIPVVNEFIGICIKYKMVPVFHVKTWTAIKPLVALIEQYHLKGKCIIASTIPDHFRILRETGCQERIHLFWGHSENIDDLMNYGNASISYDIASPEADITGKEDYQDYKPTTTLELINMCNQLGMNACLKGTNKIDVAKKLSAMGVAFITTDYLYTLEDLNTGITEVKL